MSYWYNNFLTGQQVETDPSPVKSGLLDKDGNPLVREKKIGFHIPKKPLDATR